MYVDTSVFPDYLDASDGKFMVDSLVSWILCRSVCQVDQKLRASMAQTQDWQNPMSPLPPPEPPPFSWSWENKPSWYHSIPLSESSETVEPEPELEPELKPEPEPELGFESQQYWSYLVDHFIDKFDPANIADFVFGPCEHPELAFWQNRDDNKVTIHLCDPRRLWRLIMQRAYIYQHN